MNIHKLGELPESILPHVGGKARGLDFLTKHGFKIPRGFVVEYAEGMTEDDEKAIYQAFEELNTEIVSVRSSATTEDGNEHSAAGQYETYLFVYRNDLIPCIKKCVASLSSRRASAYNEKFSGHAEAHMNVVVEKMIDSRVAGVMFTVDPTNPENVLIESVDGQGENLVSGSHESYRYSIIKAGFAGDFEGNLTKDELRKIYEEGLKISKEYGQESDLEWAIGKNGKLYWLQLRPITATSASLIGEFNNPNSLIDHLVTTRNIGEMLPGAVTPLSISTSVHAIDYGIRNMFKRAGATKHVDDLPTYNNAFVYDYHLFIDMTALHYLGMKVGLASQSAMNLSIMGESDIESPALKGKKANPFTRAWNSVRFMKYCFSAKKAMKEAVRINDSISFKPTEDINDLYRQIDQQVHYIDDVLSEHYVCSSYSGTMNSTLYMTIGKKFATREEYQDFVSTLLSDIPDIESADILASLRNLARVLKDEKPEVVAYDEKKLLAYLDKDAGDKAKGLYADFIKKHGHRSIKEAEMRSRGWKDDRLSLMKNLKVVLSSIDEVEEKPPFDMDKAVASFKGNKSTVKAIGKMARKAVSSREFSKSLIIKVIDKFKDQYRILAKLLVEKGLLEDEDSIYFLTHQEIGKLIEGDSSLKKKALDRRIAFAEAEDLAFNDIIIGEPKPIEEEVLESESILKGIPVCRGKVYGKARIVRTPEDAEHIEKGEIMVAPFTDIGWSPYYSIVSALVTEVGSALSHGAVVAREYSLPTIVNCKRATKLIKDGDYLRIDAGKGIVELIDESEYKAHLLEA